MENITLEEAINTAIEYETRIHDLYQKAAVDIKDPKGKQILKALGTDELHHITYLIKTRDRYLDTGQLAVEALDSTLPILNTALNDIKEVGSDLSSDDLGDAKQILSRALRVEIETSNFYRKMTREMSDDAQKMFARFLELESEHINVVQAGLDHLSNTGYWFGFKEFDMDH